MSDKKDVTKVTENEVAETTETRKTVQLTVKITSIEVRDAFGIMENGHHRVLTNDELLKQPEESIVPKKVVDIEFDTPINKVLFQNGIRVDALVTKFNRDLKDLVPKLVKACDVLFTHKKDLYEKCIIEDWLLGATLNIEQSFYEKDETFEDTNQVASQDCWHTVITNVTLRDDKLQNLKQFEKLAVELTMLKQKQLLMERLGLQA